MKFIGVMTGNSLDAIDIVLTDFNHKQIKDICGHSKPIPQEIREKFILLRQKLSSNFGDIENIYQESTADFHLLHDEYIKLVAQTIDELISQNNISKSDIKAVGFHGQTCHHFPPSIAGETNEPSTLQIGSGQMLADLIELPVVFDFRSDDIMNGGEGSPLSPIHHMHIAENLKEQEIFPLAFCNGGNSGNITIISEDLNSKELQVIGWDVGPFNHFVDYLARTEADLPCDLDGQIGSQGQTNFNLRDKLFSSAVITANGRNFLHISPPKSSDPAWYKIIPELVDKSIPLADRIYTAECFSAEIFVRSLGQIPFNFKRPKHFLLFGGGWNNPVIRNHFEKTLRGKNTSFHYGSKSIKSTYIPDAIIQKSDTFGYSSKYMEARLIADMAKCFIDNQPYTLPAVTNCQSSTKCGTIAYPQGNNNILWSRAAKGWSNKKESR
ncbi:MAG: hypothetical protein E7012_02970 [Alphaproteobacteria bacterium]|nr:hypothetical protein [Alphaproteobacteria bacterium]